MLRATLYSACFCTGSTYRLKFVDYLHLLLQLNLHSLPVEAQLATSLTILGAWIGCLVASGPSQKYGKRMVLLCNNAFFIVGAVFSCTGNIATLFIGRFISGIGVGVASATPSVLLAEIATPETRGTISTLHQVRHYLDRMSMPTYALYYIYHISARLCNNYRQQHKLTILATQLSGVPTAWSSGHLWRGCTGDGHVGNIRELSDWIRVRHVRGSRVAIYTGMYPG